MLLLDALDTSPLFATIHHGDGVLTQPQRSQRCAARIVENTLGSDTSAVRWITQKKVPSLYLNQGSWANGPSNLRRAQHAT